MRVTQCFIPEFVSFPILGTVMCGTTGFQSPADDYEQERIDLARELVTTIASVLVARADGNSMVKAGIQHGDLLVFDRAVEPKSGDIVLADIHDMRVVKRLRIAKGRCYLVAEAEGHAAIAVDPDQGVTIVGVLKHAIHSF